MTEFERFVARVNAYGYLPLTDGESAMAKAIKLAKGREFTFAPTGGGQASKYPWDEWFSPDLKVFPGGLILLERSVGKENDKGTIEDITEKKDFEVSVDAMVPKLKTAARRRYKVVQISRRDADGNRLVESLILRAHDMTPEERQAEDILRAEEKAARKEKAESNGDDADDTAPVVQHAQS